MLTADTWTVAAPGGAPLRRRRGVGCACCCWITQALKSVRDMAWTREVHVGVAEAAELGALAAVRAGLVDDDIELLVRPGTTSSL